MSKWPWPHKLNRMVRAVPSALQRSASSMAPFTAWFASGAEGILPAPEANHAVKGALDEALKCKKEGKSKTILFNLCGHGNYDMMAYSEYFAGKLVDQNYDESDLSSAPACLPPVAAAA